MGSVKTRRLLNKKLSRPAIEQDSNRVSRASSTAPRDIHSPPRTVAGSRERQGATTRPGQQESSPSTGRHGATPRAGNARTTGAGLAAPDRYVPSRIPAPPRAVTGAMGLTDLAKALNLEPGSTSTDKHQPQVAIHQRRKGIVNLSLPRPQLTHRHGRLDGTQELDGQTRGNIATRMPTPPTREGSPTTVHATSGPNPWITEAHRPVDLQPPELLPVTWLAWSGVRLGEGCVDLGCWTGHGGRSQARGSRPSETSSWWSTQGAAHSSPTRWGTPRSLSRERRAFTSVPPPSIVGRFLWLRLRAQRQELEGWTPRLSPPRIWLGELRPGQDSEIEEID